MNWKKRFLAYPLIGLAIIWGFAALVILTVGYEPIDAVCVVDSWEGKRNLTYSEACEIDWLLFLKATVQGAAKIGLIAAIAGEFAALLIWFATKIDRPNQNSNQLDDDARADDKVF